MTVRFSIVTPSLNQAAYLGRAVDSILNQEGDFEIEYFVIDGGSTDGSTDIIRRRAADVMNGGWKSKCRGVRMHWVSEQDNGQTAAINKGLRRASGDIAAFLNSDDEYLPGAFARVARAFQQNPPADFVHGDGEVIDQAGGLQWRWLSRPYNHAVLTSYHFLWNDFTNYIMQQSTFWRTSAHARIGLFDESLHFAMDLEYWVRSGEKGLKWRHIPKPLARFRMIPGTKSLSDPLVFWGDSLEIFRRYRGLKRMPIFFAYYCFNVGLHRKFDLDLVRQEQTKLLRRWTDLPEAERMMLNQQAGKGFALGCYLIANHKQRQGDFAGADLAIRRAAEEYASATRHPIAVYSRVKQQLQGRPAAALDSCLDRVAMFYRRTRIDYRYHQRSADLT